MMAKEYKVNLFGFLDSLDMKSPVYFKNLSEEQKKEIHPLVAMRWLTGSNDSMQIYLLNELVNPFVFSLGKHKELLVNLMAISGQKVNRRHHKFIKVKKAQTTAPNALKVIKQFLNYSTRNALEALKIISDEDILSFAEQLGKQQPEISVIKRELKLRRN